MSRRQKRKGEENEFLESVCLVVGRQSLFFGVDVEFSSKKKA